MAAQMDLIVMKLSNHVLAAAYRGDPSGPAPDPESLAGTGLVIRDPVTGDTRLSVGPQHLAVQSVDLRDDVLLSANSFELVDNLPEKGAAAVANALALNGSTIVVKVAANAPAEGTPVIVYIEGGQQPIVHRVVVPEGVATASEPLLLPGGTYRTLYLTAGVLATFAEITIP